MIKYYNFYSSNGNVTLPADNCEVYFSNPITLIPPNYIFNTYNDMLNYFINNPAKKVQNQVFKILNYSNNIAFFKFDGSNIVTASFNAIPLNYIDIFAQTTALNIYFNNDRNNAMTISANSDQGLEGLYVDHLYINNVLGTTFSLYGMN